MTRPHVLLFDESYDEQWYKKQKLMDRILEPKEIKEEDEEENNLEEMVPKSDCLIVIGTELSTGLASTIVKEFVERRKTIIEVNIN